MPPPELLDDSADFRRTLRRQHLAARSARGGADHAAASAAIVGHLRRHFAGHPPSSLGFCLPVRGECDLMPLIHELAAAGWSLCVPVIATTGQAMVFRHWTASAPLIADPHGIPVPATFTVAPPAWLLVPVVAIDAAGFRLGYGGGYFDRTLAAGATVGLRPITLGVGFAAARVADIRPQPHDVPLDAWACETGIATFA